MSVLRVLHVDDEPDIREVVAMCLSLDPYIEVRSCASGVEAIAAANADVPDLILLDVMMPAMDGPTTLGHLRQSPRTSAIPVIMMTARVQSREIDRFKLLGAAGVVAKPFDPMTLAASVRSLMPPNEDVLAASSTMFLRRLGADMDALFQCRSALGERTMLPSVLVRIRTVAHGLAGAGGIFGFPQISDAAANLEEAAAAELGDAAAPLNVESALENLVARIQASVPGLQSYSAKLH